MPVSFAAVADDDTGATDLAGMLAERGMHAVLILDEPAPKDFEQWTADADAVVLGTAARSIPASEAYDRTRRAVRLLQTLSPAVLQIKYCSTFDSTPTGNIGPSIDAAMDETGETFTVALPALPVLGRTTYMGYHFVWRQLLSDSPMRNHPLNPMTNAELSSHLQTQTKRHVGLLAYPDVRRGPEWIETRLGQLRGEGVEIAILDCTSDDDLRSLCQAMSGLKLITGSSAPAMHLPLHWTISEPRPLMSDVHRRGSGFLVVAGSYSEATRRQNEWLASRGALTFTLGAVQLASGAPTATSAKVCEALSAGRTCLLQVSRNREAVHDYFQTLGRTAVQAGEQIAQGLANLVRTITSTVMPEGLIIAGGETSSTISRVLSFGALKVGPNIEPGVPVCVTMSERSLPVVFKSGNFGSDDFYERAIQAIRHLQ